MSEVKDNNWLDKIKDLLGDTPKDKKDLITLWIRQRRIV